MAKQEHLEKQLKFGFMNERQLERFQFGLGNMFSLMTYTSIGLAIGNTLTKYDSLPKNDLDPCVVAFFGLISAGGYLFNSLKS